LPLKKKLDFKAAIHESCYVSELPGFDSTLKEIYQLAGAEVIDLEHHGECNLSCGAVSMVRTLNVTKSIFKEQRKKYKEVKKSGLNEMAINCPGCFITLSFSKNLFNKKLRYMPDELLRAYGDEITVPLNKRIKLFVRAFTKRAIFVLKKSKDKSFISPSSGVIKGKNKK
jgi:heterodisulfide reductase subunit B